MLEASKGVHCPSLSKEQTAAHQEHCKPACKLRLDLSNRHPSRVRRLQRAIAWQRRAGCGVGRRCESGSVRIRWGSHEWHWRPPTGGRRRWEEPFRFLCGSFFQSLNLSIFQSFNRSVPALFLLRTYVSRDTRRLHHCCDTASPRASVSVRPS